MEEEYTTMGMEIDMRANSKMTNKMEKEFSTMRMEILKRDCIKMDN